ncbi:hypothetical protein C8J56DRAFT_121885 [Mycena floridula]|nr:hypothetical protein C8J56DRAFT_121885 [Mycena floridula]
MVKAEPIEESKIPHGMTACPNCGHCPGSRPVDDDPLLQTARVKEILGSNQAPLDAELAENTELLQSLDETVERMKKALKTVKQDRGRIKEQLQQYSSLISPLRRLPTDVLREIFSACVGPIERTCARAIVEEMFKPRDVIIQICQQWRNIGTRYGALWQAVVVSLDRTNLSAGLRLGHHLARSGSDTLLAVWIFGNLESRSDNPLLQILLPTSIRWRSLVTRILDPAFLLPIRGFLPALQNVIINNADSAEPLDIFEFAPKLQ